MTKVKTSELSGAALDWAVAKCGGIPVAKHSTGSMHLVDTPWVDKSRVKWIAEYSPSRHWAQGGPIIERENICLRGVEGGFHAWYHQTPPKTFGTSMLIAAMRCYCCSKLGDVVDIPEELCQQQKS